MARQITTYVIEKDKLNLSNNLYFTKSTTLHECQVTANTDRYHSTPI